MSKRLSAGNENVFAGARAQSHNRAIALALFTTLLWSSSWVLIKIGLQSELPPLTFAGLRYSLAFLMLLPFVLFKPEQRQSLGALSWATWRRLAVLGLLLYTVTQGAQFIGLALLPTATLTLLLSLTPVAVAAMNVAHGDESTTKAQWGGIVLSMIGIALYFFPLTLSSGQGLGLVVGMAGMLANAAASLMGRQINRDGRLSPLIITTVSMGIGGLLLLVAGVVTQGLGVIGRREWAIIIWLALANTAVAFTIWNHTLRTLTAVESSIIANLMLPQIAILAWIVLGETLTWRQIAGLALVGVGTLVVQMRRGRPKQIAGPAVEME